MDLTDKNEKSQNEQEQLEAEGEGTLTSQDLLHLAELKTAGLPVLIQRQPMSLAVMLQDNPQRMRLMMGLVCAVVSGAGLPGLAYFDGNLIDVGRVNLSTDE